jgi:hypothetical protein
LVVLCAIIAAILPLAASTIIPNIITAIGGIISAVFLYNSRPQDKGVANE